MLIYYDEYVHFKVRSMCRLLPDTKLGEYLPEDIIRGDPAGDLTEIVDGLANIRCYQHGRDPVTEPVKNPLQAVRDIFQGFIMPCICDNILRVVKPAGLNR